MFTFKMMFQFHHKVTDTYLIDYKHASSNSKALANQPQISFQLKEIL